MTTPSNSLQYRIHQSARGSGLAAATTGENKEEVKKEEEKKQRSNLVEWHENMLN